MGDKGDVRRIKSSIKMRTLPMVVGAILLIISLPIYFLLDRVIWNGCGKASCAFYGLGAVIVGSTIGAYGLLIMVISIFSKKKTGRIFLSASIIIIITVGMVVGMLALLAHI